MLTGIGFLGFAFAVITVVAHVFSIVLAVCVRTFQDLSSGSFGRCEDLQRIRLGFDVFRSLAGSIIVDKVR